MARLLVRHRRPISHQLSTVDVGRAVKHAVGLDISYGGSIRIIRS